MRGSHPAVGPGARGEKEDQGRQRLPALAGAGRELGSESRGSGCGRKAVAGSPLPRNPGGKYTPDCNGFEGKRALNVAEFL